MMWTDNQWETFCALLGQWWPGEFGPAARAAWKVALGDVEPEPAGVALKRLLLEGRKFRPSASEFLAALRDDPSQPTFDEALILIRRALSRSSTRSEALGQLENHPLIASFVDRQGVDRLRLLPIDDPEWGPKHRADLQRAWDAHVEVFDYREIAALASGGRRELSQFDPLAFLEHKPAELGA
jgi:hypothetical protein